MATLYGGTESAVRMDTLNIGSWFTGTVGYSSPTAMIINAPGGVYRQFSGTGFTYGPSGRFNGGTLQSFYISDGSGGEPWGVVGMSMPVATFNSYVAAANTAGFLAAVFVGNDTLNGHSYYAFDDYLNGYKGHDVINGGAGHDTLVGGIGNDTLNGGIGSDYMDGGDGNDSIVGGAGNTFDSLNGGVGADTMLGGDGIDWYFVDNSGDVVIESADAGKDRVTSKISHTLSDNVEDLILDSYATALNGTGNDLANRILGNEFANKLIGLGENDTLTGAGGKDTLDGGAGADMMLGHIDNDIYYADSFDTVSEEFGTGIDLVVASTDFSLGWTLGDVENLTLLPGVADLDGWGNTLANKITGNDGENNLFGYGDKDTIIGGGGADYLNGGLGNDTLNGGLGNDTVDGGHGSNLINVFDGNDTVRHQASVDAYDVIQNFDGNPTGGTDVLDLDAMFDSLGVGTASRAGRVQLTDKGASVEVRIDTNGDSTFDYFAATIQSANTITVGEDVAVGTL